MTHPPLDSRQRVNWLRLIRTTNVGPATFRNLINRFGSAAAALDALPCLAASGGAENHPHIPSVAEIENEIEMLERMGARFVVLGEKNYPVYLSQINNPPPLLAIQGNCRIFSETPLAIVGARNASLGARKLTGMIASDLGRHGCGIISGLARGIDTAAHEGALHTGTVAVLAGGLNRPYPPENKNLLEKIIENGGAAISEMPLNNEPRAQDFPRRNRIIAGLTLGMLVVEATRRSGSLISARFALDMGRDVFAVPGFPLDPRSSGTNALIKNGAIPVTEACDILQQLKLFQEMPRNQYPLFEEKSGNDLIPVTKASDRSKVLNALGQSPVSLDDLIQDTGVHPSTLSMILLELDLAGKIQRHEGACVSLSFGKESHP